MMSARTETSASDRLLDCKMIPTGEMSENTLIDVASLLRPEFGWISQKRFHYDPSNKRRFYKVDCVALEAKVVIEYEGPNHYCDVWKSQRDDKRLLFFKSQGFTFLRWPYFCQLTRDVATYFFGDYKEDAYLECIASVYGVKSDNNILACGFHTTENTPSNYTYLGVNRFITELSELPIVVKTQVAESLRRYCRDAKDLDLVIGKDPRIHKLLEFEGLHKDLQAFYKRSP